LGWLNWKEYVRWDIAYTGRIKNGQIILIFKSKGQLLASLKNTFKETEGKWLFKTVMNKWEDNIKKGLREMVWIH
jgi:hypothetical protein